jgi:nitrate/nitrite-specific signal transduction histidine kinase
MTEDGLGSAASIAVMRHPSFGTRGARAGLLLMKGRARALRGDYEIRQMHKDGIRISMLSGRLGCESTGSRN